MVGRYHTPYVSGGPTITNIAVLDLTDRSHGNANGLGILDFTTRRAFDKFDFEHDLPERADLDRADEREDPDGPEKRPTRHPGGDQDLQHTRKMCVRLVRIKNTVALEEIAVSENLLPEVETNSNLKAQGGPYHLAFDAKGNLF